MTERWWESFYDKFLAMLLLEQTSDDEIIETLAFLDARGLPAQARVYDQCCGNGRLSIPLAQRGHEVIGVDQAAIYIEDAQQQDAPGATFSVGDASRHVVSPGCDAVINWWTSFGYAETDAENLAMIQAAFNSLKPGGLFALDFLNAPGVIRHFRRDVVTRRQTEDGDIVLVRESRLDLARGRVLKHWTYFLPDGRRVEHDTSVGLYMPHQIGAMFRHAGFVEVEHWGATDGQPLTADSPRCIITARRPEE